MVQLRADCMPLGIIMKSHEQKLTACFFIPTIFLRPDIGSVIPNMILLNLRKQPYIRVLSWELSQVNVNDIMIKGFTSLRL